MVTKKDTAIHLDTEDGKKGEEPKSPPDPHEEIKNAHASGLGAMGRPDEPANKDGEEQNSY